MKLRTPALISLAAGIGAAAAGGAYALTSGAATPLSLAAATSSQPAATSAASPMQCADGAWIGPNGIDVNGRPSFDRGDDGAVYIWHAADGWHVRTTDVENVAHHYTGAITLSAGASVTYLQPVQLEKNDRVWLSGDDTIHYDLTTYAGVDGFDFRVSGCDAGRPIETLHFSLDYNGREQDTSRIKLGPNKAHPASATFDVWRDV